MFEALLFLVILGFAIGVYVSNIKTIHKTINEVNRILDED